MTNEKKVNHPEFGYVIFTEPTSRQEQILEDYIKLRKQINDLNKLKTIYPNDFEFGQKVRRILRGDKINLDR